MLFGGITAVLLFLKPVKQKKLKPPSPVGLRRFPEAESNTWKVPPCVCQPGVQTSQSTQPEGLGHSELGQLRLITSPSDSFLPLDPLHTSKVLAENSWTYFSSLEKPRHGATFPVRSGDEALEQLLSLLSPWTQRWKPEACPGSSLFPALEAVLGNAFLGDFGP